MKKYKIKWKLIKELHGRWCDHNDISYDERTTNKNISWWKSDSFE